MDDELLGEVRLGKPVGYGEEAVGTAGFGQFCTEVAGGIAALQEEEAVREGGEGAGGVEGASDPGDEGGGAGDGAADGEVERAADVLGAAVEGTDVVEAEGGGDGLDDLDFFADAVDQHEFDVGAGDGKRDAGEAAARAHIEDAAAGGEGNGAEDRQTVQDVVLGEMAEVLAGDDVDGGVPFRVERLEGVETCGCTLREAGDCGVPGEGWGGAQIVGRVSRKAWSRMSRARKSCALTVPSGRSSSVAISS